MAYFLSNFINLLVLYRSMCSVTKGWRWFHVRGYIMQSFRKENSRTSSRVHRKLGRLDDLLDKTEKANPHNGLCLNTLHDRAFDQGYITISTDYKIIVSNVLKRKNNLDDTTRDWICSFDKKQITLPHRTLPDSKFLQYHNDVIFKR